MQATHEFILDLAGKISMPDIYRDIRKLMDNPCAKLEDYEELIRTDSLLSARILRIANSEFFGFNRKTDNLYDAISLIGLIQLHDLLLSSLCMRAFYTIPQQILNFRDFWRHGVKCGIASRSVARLCRIPASNRFFTLGLLLEIGHAAMYAKAPELTLKALEENRRSNRPIDKAEQDIFGFDYGQLGAALAEFWQLPKVYPQVIAHHLESKRCLPDFRNIAEITGFAHRFCDGAVNNKEAINRMVATHTLFKHFPKNYEEVLNHEVSLNVEQVYDMLCPPAVSKLTPGNKETRL